MKIQMLSRKTLLHKISLSLLGVFLVAMLVCCGGRRRNRALHVSPDGGPMMDTSDSDKGDGDDNDADDFVSGAFPACPECVAFTRPGQVLISELMIRPGSVMSQWIELYNTLDKPANLKNLIVQTDTGTSFTIAQDLRIDPKSFVVLTRANNFSTGNNVYDYPDNFELSPTQILTLKWQSTVLFIFSILAWSLTSFHGALICAKFRFYDTC